MTEAQIQRAVFEHFRALRIKDAYLYPVPNNPASRRTVGFVPGIPDLTCIVGGIHHAIELKTLKNGPSEDQLAAIDRIRDAGGHAVVCHGLDAALNCLRAWRAMR